MSIKSLFMLSTILVFSGFASGQELKESAVRFRYLSGKWQVQTIQCSNLAEKGVYYSPSDFKSTVVTLKDDQLILVRTGVNSCKLTSTFKVEHIVDSQATLSWGSLKPTSSTGVVGVTGTFKLKWVNSEVNNCKVEDMDSWEKAVDEFPFNMADSIVYSYYTRDSQSARIDMTAQNTPFMGDRTCADHSQVMMTLKKASDGIL